MWQLLGVEKNQNGGRCHGNQGAELHMAYDIPTRFHKV
jgi:hypothetical protein